MNNCDDVCNYLFISSNCLFVDNGHQILSSYDDGVTQSHNERAIVTPPPTSCAELAQLGNRITGFYLIADKQSNTRLQTVYCDFALAFNNPDNTPQFLSNSIYLRSITRYLITMYSMIK